jgi:hypothetical protein
MHPESITPEQMQWSAYRSLKLRWLVRHFSGGELLQRTGAQHVNKRVNKVHGVIHHQKNSRMLCIPAAHIIIFGFGSIAGASTHFVFALFGLHPVSAHRYRLLFDLTRHSSYAGSERAFTPGRFSVLLGSWYIERTSFPRASFTSGGHEAPV